MGFRKLSKKDRSYYVRISEFFPGDYLHVKLDFLGPSHVFSDLYKNKKAN